MKNSILLLFLVAVSTSFSIDWEKGEGFMHTQFDHNIHDIGFLHNSDSFMVATTYDLRWFDEEGKVYHGLRDTFLINNKQEENLTKFSISTSGRYYLKHNIHTVHYWFLYDSVFNSRSNSFIDTFKIIKYYYSSNNWYYLKLLETDFSFPSKFFISSIDYGSETHNPYGTTFHNENESQLSFDGKFQFINKKGGTAYDSHPDGNNSSYSSILQLLFSKNDTLIIYKKTREYSQKFGTVDTDIEGTEMDQYAFDPQNKYLVSNHKESLYYYSLDNLKLVAKQHFHLPVHGLGFTPDGNNVVIASDSCVYFLDHIKNRIVNKFFTGESLENCLIMPNAWGGNEFLLTAQDSNKLYKIDHNKIKKIIKADFAVENTICQTGDSIKFDNRSIGKDLTIEWDLGDGTKSTEYEPVHVYQKTGFYDVSIKVKNAEGEDVLQKHKYLEIRDRLVADFEYKTEDIGDSVKIDCYNKSTGYNIENVVWDIFDGKEYKGDTISAKIPKHPGKNFHLKLNISNELFSDSKTVRNAIEFPFEKLNVSDDHFEKIDESRVGSKSKQVFTDTSAMGFNIVSYRTEDSLYIERVDDELEREWRIEEHFGYGCPTKVIMTGDKKIAVAWEKNGRYFDYYIIMYDTSGNIKSKKYFEGSRADGKNIFSLTNYYDNKIEINLKKKGVNEGIVFDDKLVATDTIYTDFIHFIRADKIVPLYYYSNYDFQNNMRFQISKWRFRYYDGYYSENQLAFYSKNEMKGGIAQLPDGVNLSNIRSLALKNNIALVLWDKYIRQYTFVNGEIIQDIFSVPLTKSIEIKKVEDDFVLIAGSRNDSMTVIKYNYKTGESEDFLNLNRYGYITDIDVQGDRILLTGTLTKNAKETGLYQLLINPNEDPGTIDPGDDDQDDQDTTENDPEITITDNLAYPNPVIDDGNIKITLDEKGKVKTEVFDVKGIRVLKKENEFEAGKQTINLNTAGLEPGIYYYIIKYNGRIARGKMVKVQN